MVDGILRESSPDLSLVSSDVALRFRWSVLNESLGSDHLIIRLSSSYASNFKIDKKRTFKLANWECYRSFLHNLFLNISVPDDPQAAYNLFIENINKAADLHIPTIKICLNP